MHSLLKKKLSNQEEIILTIESESMFPMIQKGDSVMICQSESYKIGDVIVFRPLRREYYVSHRMIWKSINGRYYTKGDKAHMYDESIVKGRILGKIVAIKEKNRNRFFDLKAQRLLGILSLIEIFILSPLIFFPGTWNKRIKIMAIFHSAYYKLFVKPVAKRRRSKLCSNI